jgi:hypothetical protein
MNLRALAVNVSFFPVDGPGEEDKSSDVLSAMLLKDHDVGVQN